MTITRRFSLVSALGGMALGLALAGCDTLRAPASVAPIDRHTIFFAPDSATLDEPAQVVVRRLADEARTAKVTEILLEAFANRMDSGVENRVLADQRAVGISRALEAAGVDPKIIRTVVIGEAQRIGPSGLEGRRVDVTLRR